MAYPEQDRSTEPDDKLDALVRAIAAELIQLGYRPAERRGEVASETLGARTVDPAIWASMIAIQGGGKT